MKGGIPMELLQSIHARDTLPVTAALIYTFTVFHFFIASWTRPIW